MKITTLLETNTTPSSDPAANQSQQAPKFGRDPHVLEDEQLDEMTAGAIATGEPANLGVQRRGKGSMLQGIKTSKKFPNSAAVKEGVAEDQLEEYGDTAKGQKMLAKVHHRAADRVTSKQADKDPAYARKAQQTQDRAWDRLAVKEQGVAEGSLNEFAPDGFNGGDDGDEFSPEIAKMAQEDGFTKGVSLADGATLERAMAINYWHSQHGGMYKQYFAKGFKAGRMNKINHDNKQYNLNLKLMKDGSIRHGEQGVAEGSTEQVYKVLAVDKSNALSKQVKLKVKASSLDEVFERLAINDWYPLEINGVEVINGKRLKQGVAEGEDDLVDLGPALRNLTGEFNKFMKHDDRMKTDPAYAKKWNKRYAKYAGNNDHSIYDDPDDGKEQGVAEGTNDDFEQAHHNEVERYIAAHGTPGEYSHKYDDMGNAHNSYLTYPGRTVTINTQQYGDRFGHNVFTKKEKEVDEGHDKWGWHTSVTNGEFMPTKYGNKNYVYLHDLDNESPRGGPQLVTFNKPTHAKKAARQFGGKVVKTDLNTYRIAKPVGQGVTEAEKYPEPEQQVIDATRRARLQREREPQGSEKIDAILAQQHAQRQEYEKTGKFWLKTKAQPQVHVEGPFIGKQAANQAALDLLKRAPDLKGNLLITAYGPDENNVMEAELSEEQLLAKELKKQLELFKKGADHDLGDRPSDHDLGSKPKDKEIQTKESFKNEMKINEFMSEGKPGLWANIHAKRERIKHGSGERMRKPGSKGAPSAQDFKDAAKTSKTDEAANPAQQAAIAIAMKKKGQKPKNEEFNPEYDDEAGMADNNLETLERAVDGIDELINAGDNLPEWCQEKIAVAKSMLVTVWDYMKSEEETKMAEAQFDMIESMVESWAQKHGVDVDVIWEDLTEVADEELVSLCEDWQKVNKKDKTPGMSRKAVKAYRRENPGSKLQTAVTTKPSKLKKGSKAAKRRKSFCARMSGMKKAHASAKTKRNPDSPINKALRRWNC